MPDNNEIGTSKVSPDEMLSDDEREALAINQQNEAEDVNKIVDEGIISAEQATAFSHEDEIQIPEALLSKPPELSEKLAKHVVSKFPPDSFQPENIAGTLIHGTYIHSIKPTWSGEGGPRTGYSGRGDYQHNTVNLSEGIFNVTGDCTELDKAGFNYVEGGQRSPGFSSTDFPIYLVVGHDSVFDTREEEVMLNSTGNEHLFDKEGRLVSIDAVVLAADTRRSLKEKLAEEEQWLTGIIENTRTLADIDIFLSLPKKFTEGIDVEAMKQASAFILPQDKSEQKVIIEEFTRYLTIESERIDEKIQSYTEVDRIDRYGSPVVDPAQDRLSTYSERLKRAMEIAKKSIDNEDYEGATYLPDFAKERFLSWYYKNKLLPTEEIIGHLNQSIINAKRTLHKHNGEDLYEAAGSVDSRGLYLTLRQEANYIAHCMVQGVDKSKIVPIYDWDGNLLWPQEKQAGEKPVEEDSNPIVTETEDTSS